MSDWILVVDDDTSNLKMASYILGGVQMRVSCLKAGGDAVQFLWENRPDLILLDDVGKIGVPDAIINKPAHLTEEEFTVIKNHPVMGARILKNIKDFPKLITGARWHHERYDGKGYPDGIAAEEYAECGIGAGYR